MTKLYWFCDECSLAEEVKPEKFPEISDKMADHYAKHTADEIMKTMKRQEQKK
jgi:hypothetical protein